MTPEQFCYWLNGALEICDPAALTPEQTTMIKKHLALVFMNVTRASTPGVGGGGDGSRERLLVSCSADTGGQDAAVITTAYHGVYTIDAPKTKWLHTRIC